MMPFDTFYGHYDPSTSSSDAYTFSFSVTTKYHVFLAIQEKGDFLE